MQVRLNSRLHLKTQPDANGMALVEVKVMDEDELVVEIDGQLHYPSNQTVKPGEHWTIIKTIRPHYLQGATVEVISHGNRQSDYKVRLVKLDEGRRLPRNAQFTAHFTVQRSHLAGRT